MNIDSELMNSSAHHNEIIESCCKFVKKNDVLIVRHLIFKHF